MKVGKSYDEYKLPAGAKTYSKHLEELVTCAACGKQIKFNDGYTSLEIHTNCGFGYIVCDACYQQELKRKYKEQQ